MVCAFMSPTLPHCLITIHSTYTIPDIYVSNIHCKIYASVLVTSPQLIIIIDCMLQGRVGLRRGHRFMSGVFQSNSE